MIRVRVHLERPRTPFAVEVDPAWCPHGATRFRALVEGGVLDDCRLWRAVFGFICQWAFPVTPRGAVNSAVEDHFGCCTFVEFLGSKFREMTPFPEI